MVHAFSLKCSGWRAGVGPGVGLGPPPSPSGSVSTAAAPAAVLLAARTSSAGRAQPCGRGRRVAARVGAEAGVGRLALALRVERARQKVESECAPHLDPGRRLGLGRGRGEPRRGDEGPRADASVGGVRVDDGVDELRPLWRLDVEREPLGAHHLLERPPPLGRHLEHPAEQLRRQLRHVRGQRGEALPDLLVQQRGRVRLEGEPVAEQHVQDDAEGPDVRLSAVVARGAVEVEDLGRDVVRRAARGGEQLPRLHDGREPKVCDADLKVVSDPLEKDVLRLEVAVRDAERVAKGDAAADLREDGAHLLLAEARLRVEHLEQVASVHVLHHHQDLGGRVQHLVKPDDVRVVEQLEEPDLARQPLPLRREHDPVPVEALDGNHLPVGQPLRQLHLAKCPRPERAADAVLVRRLAGAANAAGRPAPHVRPP
mmetsp:Transcript_33881/g.112083  ORF Transcript_33881/g.112083 Transcript_33881/m.112083 type:complete len:428 (+) Transcript_33881:132-1415(+)